ncbi:N-acetylmuramidase family protein [Ruegeria jejuensis]|uniref:N-acetylmuramidase family protein n=1 Tax=Ruegeria jejuensis TaxID=3233338 RepID=UPI00355B4C61
MQRITGSVGQDGANAEGDVRIVRALLRRHRIWLGTERDLPEDGPADQSLITAISAFQIGACALRVADGRVDPNGFTLRRLNLPNIPAPRHDVFNFCFRRDGDAISDTAFAGAAQTLGCEVAAIRAVAEVESPRGAWLDDGRPSILYERHYFRDRTNSAYNLTHPHLSGPYGGSYGTFGQQYDKLTAAATLNERAALESASWGRFQIMGANYTQTGHADVFAFVTDMNTSTARQLEAFVAFIQNDTVLSQAIIAKDWTRFAARYNGENYRDNQYDTRMAAAYRRYAAKVPTQ